MLKALQIGCGSISSAWLSTIVKRNDIEICGIVDIDIETAEKRAVEHGLECPVFSDIEEALEKTKPDIAIDNIVPEGRLKLADACLSKGVHVFSEKPLSDSIEDAKKIVELSNRFGRNFFIMQNRRYSTNMFSFKNAIQSGRLGSIGYLSAEFFRDPHFGGFRNMMESPLLVDMAIHTFDQSRFLLGKDPVSVFCHEYNPGWSWYSGKSSAICIFKFKDDIIFHYTGSWCAPGEKTSWDSRWRATGSAGTCIWNGSDFPEAEASIPQDKDSYHPETRKVELKKIECSPEGHSGCINEMIESIKRGKPAQTDCRDNIKSLAMVFAAVKSAREKREVSIKEILEV